MGWLDKLPDGVKIAANFVSNPMELTQLKELVNHFVVLYGYNVDFGQVIGGPPTAAMCAAKELEREGKYNEQYNIESAEKTARTPARREIIWTTSTAPIGAGAIMNRQFRAIAMCGKLYARF